MKSLKNSVIAIVLATALAMAVSAQQASTGDQQHNQNMQGMQSMRGQNGNMNHMMQNCKKNMQPMMQTNSRTKKDIEAAKASNDPAKMRAALDEAERAIDGMNTHMNTCMSMMDMMHMHGGMMGGEQSKPQTQNPPKQ